MISPAAAELIRRAQKQTREGIGCVLRAEYEMGRVWFNAAHATLDVLHALLDEPAQKPLRRLVVVGPREDAEPEWFARKANDNGGDGAA